MSKKDLQFIDQALAHPWMFWVYFWKWPRIVRQACAEYDLLAKERDVAKEAHEQAVRANKIVRDWIHVTHRLDMTADMRAIWTAGKRLSALLLFLALTLSANAQLPPILRNQWTTNANPLALKVISTNGVHAATNVWEVDFTNTATVTVSAVSNANKVMVSFDGSASGQPPSANLTNWSNLPTNGVFIEKTNGLGIRTTFQEWISVTNTASSVAKITNGGYLGASFLSDSPGSHARANAGGIASGTFDRATNCFPWSFWGSQAYGYFERSSNVFLLAQLGGNSSAEVIDSRDSSLDSSEGGQAGAWINKAGSCTLQVRGGGLGGVAFDQVTNCSAFVDIALGFGYFLGTNGSLTARQGALAVGTIGENGRLYASESAMSVGRNIVSTNSWTLGHHYTNDQDFSFAIGFSGVKQFGVASNGLITIEAIDYNFPNAHAAGVWTNDGAGVTGWKPLSDFVSGGGGIASVYTNNVLAGGPGLTELGFTNTATITWTATTNAGRVTMSATSAGGTVYTNLFQETNGNIGIGISTPKASLEVKDILASGALPSEIRNNIAITNGFGRFAFYEGTNLGGYLQYIGSGHSTVARRGDFEVTPGGSGKVVFGLGDPVTYAFPNGVVSVGGTASVTPGRKLRVGRSADGFNGIELTANSTTWTLDHRGSATSNSFMFSSPAGNTVQITDGGRIITPSLAVGIANQAVITNILSGSATLDFPSTSSGAVADLAITVTGAASGDVVAIGVPQGSATGIIGSYSGFASNNTVFVRFVPTAATQDPASGTFKALVTKF